LQLIVLKLRDLRVVGQRATPDSLRVKMQQSCATQFADQKAHAASVLEVVHVGLAIRINARQQRHNGRQRVEVFPAQFDACRTRHRHQMQQVIGRAAGSMQADDRIDETAFVEQSSQRAVVGALRGQLQHAFDGGIGQCAAQRGAGIDETRTGQMQAHDFHQHLIGIGGAVEGAGAGAVIRGGFGFQQFIAVGLAFGIALADGGFLLVGQNRWASVRRE